MLDRRERSGELIEGLICAQEGHQARIWTCLPGTVQSFDPVKRTVVVQPVIKALVQKSDGSEEWVALPLLMDCPVQFAGAGDVVLTFPIKAGDEVLVVFASRCIDAWWERGGIQEQAELRMHDLSDGFCIPGVSSVPNVEAGISTTEATLRSRDGVTTVRLNPTTHTVTTETTNAVVTVKPNEVDIDVGSAHVAVKPGEIDLSIGASTVAMTTASIIMNQVGASFNLSGGQVAVTGAFIINGAPYTNHHHSGVTTGTGTSGGVV